MLRIGELSRRTGMARDTIRFYEREGLISSEMSVEPSNSYRRYDEALVDRLLMIAEARDAGFSVADLRRLFTGLDGMADGAFDAQDFMDKKIADLRALIARSKKLIAMLQAAKRALASSLIVEGPSHG